MIQQTTSEASSQSSSSAQQDTLQEQSCSSSSSSLPPPPPHRTAQPGDVVTIDLNLTPEHGYVPHPLFDTQGRITFVLGWGNYLPGLHTLVQGMQVGERAEDGISIDAGWGKRRDDLVVTVPKSKLKALKDVSVVKEGCQLHLEGDIQVLVTKVTEDTITVDANPPLAGASYRCDLLSIVKIESQQNDDTYKVATFGLGCFWGAQLAFSRTVGVVGTKSGYTQGILHNPTYEQVCEGKTRHVEAVMVVYNPKEVSYEELMRVAIERLDQSSSTADIFSINDLFDEGDDNDNDNDDEDHSEQYRHGFYYHTEEQRRLAQALLDKKDNNNRFRIELLPSAKFFNAEEYHQHYLLKGGQSARKGAKETIRCFG